ncbi:MAG TPA: hypothetical protein ENN40_11785 [Candidatus Aminicenantes bacterium]|nr:hypothetical protein [Candidatus Aminicenantes bacterium]
MNAVHIVLTGLGVVVVFLGLVFVIGGRFVPGLIILGTGIALTVLGLRGTRTKNVVLESKLELSGDVKLEDLNCRYCGASLSADQAALRAGTVFVSCPYCRHEYQLEEAPKW